MNAKKLISFLFFFALLASPGIATAGNVDVQTGRVRAIVNNGGVQIQSGQMNLIVSPNKLPISVYLRRIWQNRNSLSRNSTQIAKYTQVQSPQQTCKTGGYIQQSTQMSNAGTGVVQTSNSASTMVCR